VVERPGFGLSDFQKGRKLLDWPEDVTAFADALGIERFAVAGNSEVDQEMLSHPEIKKMLMENYREAMRAEVRGFAREDISIPVGVWHSEEDANVSSSAARHVAKTIPECRATLLPGEGHWLFLGHWEEILRSLLS
jgi:pimeloyl-ACP methyl ester carboxylesterase